MKKLLKKTIQPIIYTSILLGAFFSSQSYATVVSVDPTSTTVGLNSTFSVLLKGTGFNNVTGFGFDLKWDSSIVKLVSAVVDGTPWEFTTSNSGGTNVHAIGSGMASGIGGTSFSSRSGDVDLVNLNFLSLGKLGSTKLDLGLSKNPVWLWADTTGAIIPTLNNGEITVVPVPAAIWFLLTGIASLSAFGRRQVLR